MHSLTADDYSLCRVLLKPCCMWRLATELFLLLERRSSIPVTGSAAILHKELRFNFFFPH